MQFAQSTCTLGKGYRSFKMDMRVTLDRCRARGLDFDNSEGTFCAGLGLPLPDIKWDRIQALGLALGLSLRLRDGKWALSGGLRAV